MLLIFLLISCSSSNSSATSNTNVSYNPLMTAIKSDDIDSITSLLASSDDIDTTLIVDGKTAYEMTENEEIKRKIEEYNGGPLFINTINDNTEIFNANSLVSVIRAGINNINYQDNDGNTALIIATKANKEDL